jgi:hypothetical protein
MGKSYKKPIITDSSKSSKKISHGKFRKKVKQKIQEQRFDEIPEHEKEVTNQYDVCDYRLRWYNDLESHYANNLNMTEEEIEHEKRKYTNK